MDALVPKPCRHHAGGKALAQKYRDMASYVLGEVEEMKVWELTTQCTHCLMLLRALQVEAELVGQAPETVLSRVKSRTAMPRKESPETAAQKPAEPVEEHSEQVALILKDFVGDDAGQAGAKSWW
jgi:hypothetical protein